MLNKLHNGAIVQLRNGKNYIKVDNILVNMNCLGGFVFLTSFDENGICLDHNFDVMKYNNSYNKDYCNAAHQVFLCDTWTWDRKNQILTDEEYNYLASVIAPFKDRVKTICKNSASYKENTAYIHIILKDNDFITLPLFNADKSYLGMELDKRYTLKELSL